MAIRKGTKNQVLAKIDTTFNSLKLKEAHAAHLAVNSARFFRKQDYLAAARLYALAIAEDYACEELSKLLRELNEILQEYRESLAIENKLKQKPKINENK